MQIEHSNNRINSRKQSTSFSSQKLRMTNEFGFWFDLCFENIVKWQRNSSESTIETKNRKRKTKRQENPNEWRSLWEFRELREFSIINGQYNHLIYGSMTFLPSGGQQACNWDILIEFTFLKWRKLNSSLEKIFPPAAFSRRNLFESRAYSLNIPLYFFKRYNLNWNVYENVQPNIGGRWWCVRLHQSQDSMSLDFGFIQIECLNKTPNEHTPNENYRSIDLFYYKKEH